MGNPRPTFLLEHATLVSYSCVGGGGTPGCSWTAADSCWTPSSSRLTPQARSLRPGLALDLAFYPQINHFRGAGRCSC